MSNVREQLLWLKHPFTVMSKPKYGEMLMQAYTYANETSPDPSTKNGAVLIGQDGSTLGFGVNRFPRGVAETPSRLTDKAVKYRMVVHAESSTVFNAARHGKKVQGSTLYCPFYSCCECAKAIIQGGIVRVIGHAQLMALASEHTTWVGSIINAWAMLNEAGVECCLYDGVVGTTTRFNGQDVPV